MHYSTISAVLCALPVALAQYGGGNTPTTTTSSTASSGTTASVAVHTVTVGANGALAFSPNNLTAAVGEIVEFVFYPQKHSVAQSSFAAPCTPFSNGTSFFSGGMSTTSGTNPNTFQITINSTAPIWFYCAFPTHCESGMAGVINQVAGSPNTLDAYVAAAANANGTAPTVVQGGIVGAALSASSSGTSTGTSTSSSSTSTSKSAGVETRGAVRWVLLGFTGAVAVGIGSLMV